MGDSAVIRKRTWRQIRTALALGCFLLLLGLGVREAEFSSVGASNDVSLWIFYGAGVCLYVAFLRLFILFRGYLKSRR